MRDREETVLARLHALAPHLDGEPDPDFRAATRARLVAMAAVRAPQPEPASWLERLLSGRAPDVAPGRWRTRLTAGIAGAALTLTAVAALVAVAGGARPGDVLYDLKRGTEQTRLALAGDARGRTLLALASTRLDEMAALVGEDGTALPATPARTGVGAVSAAGADPALLLATLRTMDGQTAQGAAWLTDRALDSGSAQPLDDLAGWAADQSGELAALGSRVPREVTPALGQSLTLLAEIGERTGGLGASLACPGGPAVGAADDLGPVPAPCPAAEPDPPETPGRTTDAGVGTEPGATPPESTAAGQPTLPPSAVPDAPDGSGGLPTPSLPAPTPGGGMVPSMPLPPLRSLPPLRPLPPLRSLPGDTGGGTATGSPPVVQLPPAGPIPLCLPPLATLGDC